MLTALEKGVRGGRWHTLIDKVFAEINLFTAIRKVVSNKGAPGVDHVTVEKFDSHSREELARLQAELKDETYPGVSHCGPIFIGEFINVYPFYLDLT